MAWRGVPYLIALLCTSRVISKVPRYYVYTYHKVSTLGILRVIRSNAFCIFCGLPLCLILNA